MNGRTLVHFASPAHWDMEQKYHIAWCDYTGHRARHGGNHFVATHAVRLTAEELYAVLEPYMEHGPGNEPDMATCDGCGRECFGDEIEFTPDDRLLCPACLSKIVKERRT